MQITVQVKIIPTQEQCTILKHTIIEYISAVNMTVLTMMNNGTTKGLSSKDVLVELPSALRGQIVIDAKSVYQKYRKTKKQSVLRKPVAIWNNQNWTLKDGVLSFPVWIDGRSQRISVPALATPYQLERLNTGKLGTLRLTEKSGKWIAQIAVNLPEAATPGDTVMGVDLGLKVPAVAVTSTGKTRFFGNGRQNKYRKRKYRSQRKKLGKAKKLKAIRRMHNKEQRWMQDQDHKVSRQIVNMAAAQGVGIIRLESLSGIRQTARTSRKNEKNLHTWSFFRLANYIEYKAALLGIRVEYVNPEYTSQTCPVCGSKNKVKGRDYRCSCGYHTHRDRLGALNIITAPVADGNSLSA